MGRFDLNNSADFAKVVLSDVGKLLGDFTGKNPADWDIQEGSFNGVVFHVFKSKSDWDGALGSITDTGGRRKAKFKFPYVDGQTTDDLGRLGEGFDLDILIHGPRYKNGLEALMRELNKPTPGDLVHPVRGKIKCVMEHFQLLHSSEKRKAVAIRLTLIEHSFTIGGFDSKADSTVKGALAQALDAIQKIQNVIQTVTGAIQFANDVKSHFLTLLNDFKGGYSQTVGKINTTYNRGGSVDIPALLPVNNGGTLNADGSIKNSNFPTASSPSDPFANIPVSSVTTATATAIATSQLIKETNALRANLTTIIDELSASVGGAGSLIFYSEILDLKTSAIILQQALEKGISSSQTRLIKYTTPRIMSLREVAFANGVDVDRVYDLEVLNPQLLSTNFIEKGTEIQVPVA